MSTETLSDLISQTQAAEIRGVTREAIADLIRRGKLTVLEVAGRKLLRRSDVENYTPEVGGRPKKADEAEAIEATRISAPVRAKANKATNDTAAKPAKKRTPRKAKQ
jgi:hypothetical protein